MTIDFAIIGQPKSGTTALAAFLAQHPRVCVSVPKETARFATDLQRASDEFHGAVRYFKVRDDATYAAAFAHCTPGQLRGDASTAYLHSREAAANVHAANPDARLVVLLREPVSYMHSLHMQYCNETTEDEPSFERALELEAERIAGRSIPSRVRVPSFVLYRERARYAPQLERWYEHFDREQVLVLLAEEFQRDNAGHVRRVLAHLGIDDAEQFEPEVGTVHGSAEPRNALVNRVLNNPALKNTLFRVVGPQRYTAVRKRVGSLMMRPARREQLDPQLVARLREELGPDVDAASALIGRDLRAAWGW
ncbi:MAG: sulfotransferase [Gaiellales bacterium]